MKYSYEINPRPVELGGGWQLRLLEDGQEIAGGVFPIVLNNPQGGMVWWNSISEQDRAHWLAEAKSAVPADAWISFQRAEAYTDAEAEASEWLDSRDEHERT